jgi:hypothetical protein
MNHGSSRWIIIIFVTISVLCSSTPDQAASASDSMNLATELGDVLASEEFCGLHYDQGAIGKFIDSHVSPDDMAFTPMLTMITTGQGLENEQMSKSAKTAHCVQITRVARSYGFIQ